jgi:hypothetical protein
MLYTFHDVAVASFRDVTLAKLLIVNPAIPNVPCYLSFSSRLDICFLRSSVVTPISIFVLTRHSYANEELFLTSL